MVFCFGCLAGVFPPRVYHHECRIAFATQAALTFHEENPRWTISHLLVGAQ